MFEQFNPDSICDPGSDTAGVLPNRSLQRENAIGRSADRCRSGDADRLAGGDSR